MKDKIQEMFKIQDGLNIAVCGEDYAEKHIPFYRAAIVESAELMEHRGYKWWKKSDEYDVQQAHLEIVDIWHFLMSHIISTSDMENVQNNLIVPIAACFEIYSKMLNKSIDEKESQLRSVDNFMSSLQSPSAANIGIEDFVKMMAAFHLNFDELYRMYIGKNALNYLRINNGYREGTYNKSSWIDKAGNRVEDNIVLAEILEKDWETFEDVYNSLTVRYEDACM
jgi:dimeric dUTPase (all-alpha-NTP-PPase superfamily)